MRLAKLLSIGLIAISVGGCAVAPESLKRAQKAEKIELAEPVSIVVYRGLNVRVEEGAMPGTYTAEREDAEGVYFFGKDRSIWNTMGRLAPRIYFGGIYIPSDPSQAPRFFYIFETTPQTAADINSYIQDRVAVAPVVSPGAAAGPNIVGNIVGGVLVGALLESGVGKIEMFPPIKDEAARQKILSRRQAISEGS